MDSSHCNLCKALDQKSLLPSQSKSILREKRPLTRSQCRLQRLASIMNNGDDNPLIPNTTQPPLSPFSPQRRWFPSHSMSQNVNLKNDVSSKPNQVENIIQQNQGISFTLPFKSEQAFIRIAKRGSLSADRLNNFKAKTFNIDHHLIYSQQKSHQDSTKVLRSKNQQIFKGKVADFIRWLPLDASKSQINADELCAQTSEPFYDEDVDKENVIPSSTMRLSFSKKNRTSTVNNKNSELTIEEGNLFFDNQIVDAGDVQRELDPSSQTSKKLTFVELATNTEEPSVQQQNKEDANNSALNNINQICLELECQTTTGPIDSQNSGIQNLNIYQNACDMTPCNRSSSQLKQSFHPSEQSKRHSLSVQFSASPEKHTGDECSRNKIKMRKATPLRVKNLFATKQESTDSRHTSPPPLPTRGDSQPMVQDSSQSRQLQAISSPFSASRRGPEAPNYTYTKSIFMKRHQNLNDQNGPNIFQCVICRGNHIGEPKETLKCFHFVHKGCRPIGNFDCSMCEWKQQKKENH